MDTVRLYLLYGTQDWIPVSCEQIKVSIFKNIYFNIEYFFVLIKFL